MKTSEGNIQNYVSKNTIKLTQEELVELFNSSMDSQNIIAKSQLPLVLNIANSFQTTTGVSFDEIFSAGMLGLSKAVNSYVTTSNATFTTYAKTCITNEITYQIKNCDNIIRKPYLNSNNNPVPNAYVLSNFTNDDGDNPVEDSIAYIEQDYINKDDNIEQQLINLIKETLVKKQYQDIVIWRMGLLIDKPLTYKECGEKLGLVRGTIKNQYDKAINKLKNNPLFIFKLQELTNVKEMLK